MPLQPVIISIFTSIFLLLPPPILSTGLVAKPGCLDRCGDLLIPYPFGIGPNCSLEQSFTIRCNSTVAYLSFIDQEIIEINDTYIRVKYPNLVSACYDLSSGELYKYSNLSVNFSGTPYTLTPHRNRLTTIGCDDAVLQYKGSLITGGCSAFCAAKNDTGGFGYCPHNSTSLGYGCCQTYIPGGTSFVMRAELIDLSKISQRRKLFPCSYAFIQEEEYFNATLFSYPLYYLDNITALVNDNWESTTRPPVVRLDWTIGGAMNCSTAKQNNTTYACLDEKSVCADSGDNEYGLVGRAGYQCRCVQGFEGNPYLPGGCKQISFSSSIAKYGCSDQCGKLSIPFPFGVGKNCYLEPSFEVTCDISTNPQKAYLRVLNAEIIQFTNSSQVWIDYPKLGLACYNWSDSLGRITKTEERSLIIDLSKTQYTLSDDSWITVIGCDDMVVGIIGQANKRFIGSICAAVCLDNQLYTYDNGGVYYGMCPSGRTAYLPGYGCCRAPIPRGTSYLEANLTDLSGRWPRTNFSCSYAFLGLRKGDPYYSWFPIFNNSAAIALDGSMSQSNSWLPLTTLPLDWRIGAASCKEARRNPASGYACQNNSDCVDFDGGYLCNCSKGYQGNPYLLPGCQDINECDDNSTNPCGPNSVCKNTPGSVYCSCWKGYTGDGRKDGTACIQLPPSKTKMIILTGLGSGLGFLLLLLLSFWLYKVLQKKKEDLRKEKFFERNGGLLLQQQTNEGALGRTKVFPANELDVATDHFNASRILGHGGQGTVYKGMLSDGKIVAVKKAKLVEENQLEQFINEVVILSQINHRNVVKLLGCCLETEVPLLVYEFMPNGTLFDLIHDSNNEFPFPWNMRLKIAADIAGALAYLHSASSLAIYHRDIKSSNILLDEKYVVKVSDFGTSRSIAVDQTHLTTMVKGTFGYLDPEYFQSSQFTEKSDVYSFGVVLVELLTGQRPISLDKTNEERGLATRFLTSMEQNYLDTILDPQVWVQDKKEEVITVAMLAQRCLNLKGKMRPTMKEVAAELESIRISQMPTNINGECEEVRAFEDMSRSFSEIDSTWTITSFENVTTSSSDTHPLMFTTE